MSILCDSATNTIWWGKPQGYSTSNYCSSTPWQVFQCQIISIRSMDQKRFFFKFFILMFQTSSGRISMLPSPSPTIIIHSDSCVLVFILIHVYWYCKVARKNPLLSKCPLPTHTLARGPADRGQVWKLSAPSKRPPTPSLSGQRLTKAHGGYHML